jgi:hypothetical protein
MKEVRGKNKRGRRIERSTKGKSEKKNEERRRREKEIEDLKPKKELKGYK